MFGNKKLLEEANQKISEGLAGINSTQQSLQELQQQMQAFQEEFQKIREQHKSYAHEFLQHLITIRSTRERFEEELRDIKNIKKAIELNLLNEVKSSLHEQFSEALRRLNMHISNYHDLDAKSSSMKQQLSSLETEIRKFTSISSKLKEKDFEMEKFAKQLLELDNEKLSLLRKVDTLERLIAQQRRSR